MSKALPILKRPLRYRIEAATARVLLILLSRLPTKTISALGGWLGRTIGPFTNAHNTAMQNLQQALPEADTSIQKRTLTAAWDNFGRTMTEYAVLERLHAAPANIELFGHDQLKGLAEAGKPAILFSAHLANWETIPLAIALQSKPLFIVYRAANNPLADSIVTNIRKSYTAGMAAKGSSGARQIMKALNAGQHVIMLVDQKSNTGMKVPFFGRGAYTATAVVRMAARISCPVFPVRTERIDGLKFRITIEKPFMFSDESEDGIRKGLIEINKRLEAWIEARPGQWLWMHKRWPK
ncbi:MAG TPA: lauroyl acyltransferase [Rhodospirillaceae bacterium]|nr:lauroyl acyltransferase [Candidatus Neomarinimicrobiota bacterium]HCX14758.1 lauroyl acyltransferase [Rhodospirillaceae bacterium]